MKGREFNQLRRAFDNTPDLLNRLSPVARQFEVRLRLSHVRTFFAPQWDVLCALDWPA
jgi:hypothetical protein